MRVQKDSLREASIVMTHMAESESNRGWTIKRGQSRTVTKDQSKQTTQVIHVRHIREHDFFSVAGSKALRYS